MSQSSSPRAFVLMPFDASFEAVYQSLIREPLETEGFSVHRADSLLDQRNIIQDVVRGIAESALIVADATGLNPNVMYEVGIAHAMGKRTVLIAQDIGELPFDFRSYRANEYSTHFTEATNIAETLREIGRAVIAGEIQFSNPVQDYAPTAIGEASQVSRAPGSREASTPSSRPSQNEDGDDESEPGLFENAARLAESSERSVEVLSGINEATQKIGSQIQEHTVRLERASKNLGDRGAGVLLGLLREAASDIDSFAETVEPLNVEFRTVVMELAGSATLLAKQRDVGPSDREVLLQEIAQIREAESAMVESYFSVANFAATMAELPNMDRKLTRSARHASEVVSETADIIELAQAEFARAANVIENRLPEG